MRQRLKFYHHLSYRRHRQHRHYCHLRLMLPCPKQAILLLPPRRGPGWKGCLTASIQPKNFKNANSREDAQEWVDAYCKEYRGMMDRGAVKAVKPPPGAKILGTTTRLEYKSDISESVTSPRANVACVLAETGRWKDKTSSSRICMHLP